MTHETRLVKAIEESGISRVVIIDDVFDPPAVDGDNAGQILDYLEDENAAAILATLGLNEEACREALEALGRSEYDADEVVTLVEALYRNFVSTFDDRFDPGSVFRVAKGDNLANVEPLLKLLAKCNPSLEIARIGSKFEELEAVGPETHLIFVDFYLDPAIAAEEAPKGKQKKDAKSAALVRVKRLIETQAGLAPSVVLMSSHDVRAQANTFRTGLGKGLVFASRFTFVEKTHLKVIDGGQIQIAGDAGDALLDLFQSYEFGRALHAALDCWLEAAGQAVKDLRTEIESLHLKEFAYLVRFRLAQEGQGLLEYLEWFFGECLLDAIGKAVDKAAGGDERVKALNGPAASRIEGAFDGPTKKVAQLYHRVRIEDPRAGCGSNFRLGDLYALDQKKSRSVVAVMTPDCDLISRDGGKRRAPQLLTVNGQLKPFDAPDTSVSDFVMLKARPYNIAWNKKGIATREFKDWPEPGESKDGIEYLGSLRPLYAQELQRNVLHDLGRVGVSVAPAIAVTAAVKVTVKKKSGGKEDLAIAEAGSAPCYVVPGRSEEDKSTVIFRRQFVGLLIDSLSALDPETLPANALGQFNQLKHAEAHSKLMKMFQAGIHFEEMVDLGIFLTGKPTYKSPDGGPWCWLTVSMGEL